MNPEYLLFRSKKDPKRGITIGKQSNGLYFIANVNEETLPPEMNLFSSVDEIEKLLDDELELIRPLDS